MRARKRGGGGLPLTRCLLDRTGQDRAGQYWTGLVWTGLDWTGLDQTGLHRLIVVGWRGGEKRRGNKRGKSKEGKVKRGKAFDIYIQVAELCDIQSETPRVRRNLNLDPPLIDITGDGILPLTGQEMLLIYVHDAVGRSSTIRAQLIVSSISEWG